MVHARDSLVLGGPGAQYQTRTPGRLTLRVTVSAGVASVDPRELPAYIARGTAHSGTAEILGRANQALYEAQAAGRNRVVGIALANTEIA